MVKLGRTAGLVSSEATCLLVSAENGDSGKFFSENMHGVPICNMYVRCKHTVFEQKSIYDGKLKLARVFTVDAD